MTTMSSMDNYGSSGNIVFGDETDSLIPLTSPDVEDTMQSCKCAHMQMCNCVIDSNSLETSNGQLTDGNSATGSNSMSTELIKNEGSSSINGEEPVSMEIGSNSMSELNGGSSSMDGDEPASMEIGSNSISELNEGSSSMNGEEPVNMEIGSNSMTTESPEIEEFGVDFDDSFSSGQQVLDGSADQNHHDQHDG